MATTTIAFDLVTALVATFRDKAPAGVLVYDGPEVSADPSDFLVVGVGDPDRRDSLSASGTQEWAGIGARATSEEGTVSCCAVSWSGDIDSGPGGAQQRAREKVRDIVAGVDQALHADPNLGGVVPGLEWVRYGKTYGLDQPPVDAGVLAIFRFEIFYKARLV